MEHSFELKIPKDRIAIVIGTKGESKKELEKITKCNIQIDSKEGDVKIMGKDPINTFALREVIRAIGFGHSPETAQLLLKQDYSLEVVSLKDFAKNKNHYPRLKGRVIGTNGKSRKTIEDLTGCFVCVYGKNISAIGDVESVDTAKRAIRMLLMGSNHATVYKYLEKQRKLRGDFF